MPSRSDQRAQLVEGDADGHPQQQRFRHGLVVEQLAADPRPAVLEGDGRPDLVQHLDLRREPGLDGVLGEQPLRERVQRADRRLVEVVERLACRFLRTVGLQHRPLERHAEPVPQLGSRLVGEGHRGDVAQRDVVVQHQLEHPVDQRRRLARTRTSVDEQGRPGLGAHALPSAGVGQTRGHEGTWSDSGSTSASSDRSSGAPRLRCQSSRSSP